MSSAPVGGYWLIDDGAAAGSPLPEVFVLYWASEGPLPNACGDL